MANSGDNGFIVPGITGGMRSGQFAKQTVRKNYNACYRKHLLMTRRYAEKRSK